MADRTPVVINAGRFEGLQSGDTLAIPPGLFSVYGFLSRATGDYTGSMDVLCPRQAGFGNISSYCADRTNSVLMTFAGTTGTGYSTISLSTDGIKGVGNVLGSGTATSNTGSATVTGSGTAFLTEFGTASLTGTCSSSGTTVTGTGTIFTRQIAVGDMIGNASNGYSTVTAIASDTSLTINIAIPGGALSGASVNRIEGATIKVGTKKAVQVSYITSDTSLTVTHTEAVTQTSTTYYIGNVPTGGNSYPVASYMPLYLWVGKGGTGTDVFLSTQRTAPYASSPTGYNSYFRRIGSVFIYSLTPFILPFSQMQIGNARRYIYHMALTEKLNRILTSGAATSWTTLNANVCVPATAHSLVIDAYASSNVFAGVRAAGWGSSTANLGQVYSTPIVSTFHPMTVHCNDLQQIQYSNQTTGGGTFIDVGGYEENI